MRRSYIRALLIEDNPGDARLIQELLSEAKRASFQTELAGSLSEGLEALSGTRFDVVLLDLSLPDSSGLETLTKALSTVHEESIIVLTGLDDEDVATEAVRKGAQDYLVKGQIDENVLCRAILYAIERKRAEELREKIISELQEALAEVKALSGLLPICALCKRIRDDKGYWNQLEAYVREHSQAEFTHSICPECARELYLDLHPLEQRGR